MPDPRLPRAGFLLGASVFLLSAPLAHAQATNGIVTVTQERMASGGGRAGSGNPMSAITVIGEPMGGTLSGGACTIHGGFPSAPADTTPPVISGASASNLTATTASISWTTNEPAGSQVEYGPATTYGSATPLDARVVTVHVMSLTGLSPATLYHCRVRSQDAAGNVAVSADLTFTTAAPDTIPPSGSVTITNGATATNNPIVTLTLAATDNSGTVSQMQFSNDSVTYSMPETSATTKSWTLSTGDGTKTVYAKFSDPSGNWSTPVSDSITLDTTPPSVAITTPSDGTAFGAP